MYLLFLKLQTLLIVTINYSQKKSKQTLFDAQPCTIKQKFRWSCMTAHSKFPSPDNLLEWSGKALKVLFHFESVWWCFLLFDHLK